MTYERLIIRVDEVAPNLGGIAYKLLWRLIALAIHSGRPTVEASLRELARGLKTSKEGMASATRELAQYIRVEARDGEGTTFYLPPDWFPPQRTLFSDDQLGGDFHNRPGDQDTSVPFTRTPASHLPGHQRPGSQDTRPINQDASVLFTRTPVPLTRTLRPNNQGTSHDGASQDTRARVRSIESEASASSNVVGLIDRAWGAVEIPVESEADAALLTDWVYAYKCDLGPARENSTYPDTQMIARLLAIAPIEKIHCVLRSLRERGRESGDNDAWFFTVLMQQIHSASPELTRSRMRAAKSKTPSHNGKRTSFADSLLDEVNGQLRRLG